MTNLSETTPAQVQMAIGLPVSETRGEAAANAVLLARVKADLATTRPVLIETRVLAYVVAAFHFIY